MNNLKRTLLAAALTMAAGFAVAQASPEATIRKNLTARVPQMPKIDEISKTPIPGLYEVRMGSDIFYSDAQGNYVIQGVLMDTKARRNLTEERIDKLMALEYDKLPFKDAFTIVRGDGKRQLAVFQDPNCPYCKRFEQDLQKVNNVTIHMFLYPILGSDSTAKSRNVWCAKDKGKAWTDLMVRGQLPAEAGNCDAGAMGRNVEFGRKYRINGTPTLIFANGKRVPGAISAEEVEKHLAEAK